MNPLPSRGFTWNIKSYFLWKAMIKKYLWMSPAAVVIGALRVNDWNRKNRKHRRHEQYIYSQIILPFEKKKVFDSWESCLSNVIDSDREGTDWHEFNLFKLFLWHKSYDKGSYHILINDTPFELHVFWPSATESHIKLTFSESVSPSLKTRLMTLLNMPQKSNLYLRWISFEEKVYNKQIINIELDPTHCITSRGYFYILCITFEAPHLVILGSRNIHSWYNASDQDTAVKMYMN